MCITNLGKQSCGSAVVSGEENPYKSESLKLNGKRSTTITSDKYEENLDMLISSLSFADYENMRNQNTKKQLKVSTKFMAEDDALKNFLVKRKKIKIEILIHQIIWD